MDLETEAWPNCNLCGEPVDPTNSITWANKVKGGRHWFHWTCFSDWGRKRRDMQISLEAQYPDDGTI